MFLFLYHCRQFSHLIVLGDGVLNKDAEQMVNEVCKCKTATATKKKSTGGDPRISPPVVDVLVSQTMTEAR